MSSSRRGILLTVAYDGTDFAGWQAQPGQRTVQGEMQRAIGELAGHDVDLFVASRTDAGVHALGQKVAFTTTAVIPDHGWVRGLNFSHLPPDIAVQSAQEVAADFEPRHDTREKTYRYIVLAAEAPDPLLRHRAWQTGPAHARPEAPRGSSIDGWLDIDAMRRAASTLLGTHDFSAFQAQGDYRENTVRTLHEITVVTGHHGRPDLLAIDVRGNAFLRNMVRIIVGTLVHAGGHRLTVEQVAALVQPGGQRAHGGPTAPAHGLTLMGVVLGRKSPEGSR